MEVGLWFMWSVNFCTWVLFLAILVTGARQVGKTTMLKHLAAEQSRTYVSMDNTMARALAKSDPILFFQTYKPLMIIEFEWKGKSSQVLKNQGLRGFFNWRWVRFGYRFFNPAYRLADGVLYLPWFGRGVAEYWGHKKCFRFVRGKCPSSGRNPFQL